jgi:hypothetical protein
LGKSVEFVLEEIKNLMFKHVPIEKLVITKSTKSWGDGIVQFDEKGPKMGNYRLQKKNEVPIPRDREKFLNYIREKGYWDENEFWRSKLPGHIKFAIELNERGIQFFPGDRIPYIIIYSPHDKTSDKIEDFSYYKVNTDILKINYPYYIDILVNSLSTTFDILFSPTNEPRYKKPTVYCNCQKTIKINFETCDGIMEKNLFIKKCVFCRLKFNNFSALNSIEKLRLQIFNHFKVLEDVKKFSIPKFLEK